MAFVLLGGLLLILWAWNLGPFNTTRVTTDNAYVRGQMTVLAPQVSGYVSEVLVQDFERVQAGQPLVRIDERIYKEKLHQAQAQLDAALAELANLDQARHRTAPAWMLARRPWCRLRLKPVAPRRIVIVPGNWQTKVRSRCESEIRL
ncbi:secretion protein HlyD family protein [Alcaligenes sp. HPC1271]|nr:secretion protein HlyD family protein [Alcaligenes sp. HPC1271]